jgi:hypothetical protein
MPAYMRYEGVDGRFSQDSFNFSTSEAATEHVPRTGKPSLIVKFDIGGPVGATEYSGSHALYQDVVIPTGATDDGLLLPAVQTDFGLLLPY